jgi:hypothetical protein
MFPHSPSSIFTAMGSRLCSSLNPYDFRQKRQLRRRRHGSCCVTTVLINAAGARQRDVRVLAGVEEATEERWVDKLDNRSAILAKFWLLFVGYAFLGAPGRGAEAQALDMQLLTAMIANPFSPEAHPLFV